MFKFCLTPNLLSNLFSCFHNKNKYDLMITTEYSIFEHLLHLLITRATLEEIYKNFPLDKNENYLSFLKEIRFGVVIDD